MPYTVLPLNPLKLKGTFLSPIPPFRRSAFYQPSMYAKINGATIVASDSTINFGVCISSLPHVIFSFGTAPEYEP